MRDDDGRPPVPPAAALAAELLLFLFVNDDLAGHELDVVAAPQPNDDLAGLIRLQAHQPLEEPCREHVD